MRIIDRTAITATIRRTRNGRHIFSHDNPRATRDTSRIDGIILHQTAFVSHDPARLDYVIANYVVMQDGTVLLLRDASVALNSIGTNQRSIDIEFVGNYPSIRDIRRGSIPTLPSATQVGAGRELISYLRSQNSHISFVFAHAQFTAKNCPGPHLWYNVGEWALRKGCHSGRGVPVPSGWNDASLAIAGV